VGRSRLNRPPVDPEQFQRRGMAQGLTRKNSNTASAPWDGIVSDLPHGMASPSGASDAKGLVSRPDPTGGGEVLINDSGTVAMDPTNLPLGANANSSKDIALIENFRLVGDTQGHQFEHEATSGMVLVAGDGTNADSCELWNMDPETDDWVQIIHTTSGSSVKPHGDINGDDSTNEALKSMPDACTFPNGAPGRSAYTGAIAQPAFVITNNEDPVMVYPAGSSLETFEDLTDQFTSFRAVSCEAFGDRVYFLNTLESGTRHPNRLRRTARGTCDPLATTTGAGSIDLNEFNGQGLRVETLGNILACYFEDGVAFVRETGISTAPNAVQIIDRSRGLLGNRALVNIPERGHFGIFNDGWWILDPNGRWLPVGKASANNTVVEKWKAAFYSDLDPANLHRLYCAYDHIHNYVRIIKPSTSDTADSAEIKHPTEMWVYDVLSDRVFKDNYSGTITCMGNLVIREGTAETWAQQAAGESWSDIAGTKWAQLSTSIDNIFLCHGDSTGNVYYHSDLESGRADGSANWSYTSVLSDHGTPRSLKRADKISVEHINSGNDTNMQVAVIGADGTTVSRSATMNSSGNPGQIETIEAWFTSPSSDHLQVRLSGTGPVRIRSVTLETIEKGVEEV
jgi:hypothetical protein